MPNLTFICTSNMLTCYICSCACSKHKELVDKVHAGLKTASKEAQTDTVHGGKGMPLLPSASVCAYLILVLGAARTLATSSLC